MDALAQIKEPLRNELAEYEDFVRDTLRSDSSVVGSVLDYILSGRGKGIRPLLTLLFAAVHGARPGRRAFLAGMLVEMIHTASLAHDDVVDEAPVRHGRPSVNSVWDSHTAVLIGDYILARAFTVGMDSGQFDIMAYITRSIGALCEGELLQSYHNERFDIDREAYLDIILKKTAALMGASCGAGAMSAGADAAQVETARRIGINLGMAFQIKDDILDYAPSAQTGKPSCADLRERKLTLPLLTVLETSSPERRGEIAALFRGIEMQPENIGALSGIVTEDGGLEAASEVMNRYIGEARREIADYAPSPARDSLMRLCSYIGTRDK